MHGLQSSSSRPAKEAEGAPSWLAGSRASPAVRAIPHALVNPQSVSQSSVTHLLTRAGERPGTGRLTPPVGQLSAERRDRGPRLPAGGSGEARARGGLALVPLQQDFESGKVVMGAGGGGGGGGGGGSGGARAHPGVRRGGCHQLEALLGLGGETTGEARGSRRRLGLGTTADHQSGC